MSLVNSLIIEVIIIFILLVLYFYIVDPKDNTNFLRAIFLALVLVITSSLPSFMGDYSAFGWVISLVISLYSIIRTTGQSILGSIFFLIVLEIVSYVLQMGLEKYIR